MKDVQFAEHISDRNRYLGQICGVNSKRFEELQGKQLNRVLEQPAQQLQRS